MYEIFGKRSVKLNAPSAPHMDFHLLAITSRFVIDDDSLTSVRAFVRLLGLGGWIMEMVLSDSVVKLGSGGTV